MKTLRQWLWSRTADRVKSGYAAWASLYDVGPGTPLQRSNDTALSLCVPQAPPHGVALDVACGTGRHEVLLRARGWQRLLGLDLSPEMLQRAESYPARAVADLRHLPVRPVELVVCSLAIGHVPDLPVALASLCRAVRFQGHLVLSDIHPRSSGSGYRSSFRDPAGRTHALPHHLHPIGTVTRLIEAQGLEVELVVEPPPEQPLPREPRGTGLPLVYALRARRAR